MENINGYLVEQVFVRMNEEFETSSYYSEHEYEIGDTVYKDGEQYVIVQIL